MAKTQSQFRLITYTHSKIFNHIPPLQTASKSIQKMFIHLAFLFLISLIPNHSLLAARQLADPNQQMVFQYHGGQLLSGKVSVNLIWYGKFSPSQRAILSDFIASLSAGAPAQQQQPSVAQWWNSIQHKYYDQLSSSPLTLTLAKQFSDYQTYPLGKSLTMAQIQYLAQSKSISSSTAAAVNVVLTSADVVVEGFCSSKCGTHAPSSSSAADKTQTRTHFIWVGNSETQCPGQCAWPFHQPTYGPQGPPLVSPNNDVGLDGMIITLAGLFAGTATNADKNGYFQGPKDAPLEAASACPGVYGKGAYPGYPGNLFKDQTTGASYNANGVNGRKYLLPALYDPKTASCSTLL